MGLHNLYNLILANANLRYIDGATGKIYRADDFHNSLNLETDRSLAFLYLDNTIRSVEVLLNFLRSDHVIVLLSPVIAEYLKVQLENTYSPGYIYDMSRKDMSGYKTLKCRENIILHLRIEPASYEIHHNLKYLLSTSGSTGSPKFVKLSEKNLLSNALSIVDYLPILEDDVVPLNLPLFYSYGLSVFTSNSIAGGCILCIEKDILQKDFWYDFDYYSCTSLAGVPFNYEILNRIGFCSRNYPSLRYLTQAGGKLSDGLIRNFGQYAEQFGVKFYIMYGQTEASARIAYLHPDDILRKVGSIGNSIKGGSLSLDPDTNELLYEGPNVFGGYTTCPDDLKTFDTNSLLRTGDIGRCDEDGYFYITGRLKRFIKLSGHRINLDEIEGFLKRELGNISVACHGVGDKFLYVVHSESQVSEECIIQLLSHRLHLHPRIIRVSYVNSIPLTANGKNDYRAIESILV